MKRLILSGCSRETAGFLSVMAEIMMFGLKAIKQKQSQDIVRSMKLLLRRL